MEIRKRVYSRLRVFLSLAIFVLPLSTSTTVAQQAVAGPLVGQADGRLEMPTDQVIIKYKIPALPRDAVSAASASQLQRLSDAAGMALTYFREMSGDAHVLRLPGRLALQDVQAIADRLSALPEVDYAEPDAIMVPTLTPNDPQYANQWHYLAPGGDHYGINVPGAWDITTGSASIVAAVIDTGITNHPDLNGRTVPGYDFISDSLVANDGSGRDSDPSDPGDWITSAENSSGYFKGCTVRNSSWHGTHTAGTIGAAGNNGVGVAGVNWNSKILPVRVMGKCGGITSDIVDGMRWSAGLAVPGVPANANPAKVINLSLGGSGSCPTAYQDAINAITGVGATVVVSAGNSNADVSGFRPANCNGVITTAATNRNGSRAAYSNFGSLTELSAPGGYQTYANDPNGVLSTLNTGTQGPDSPAYIYYQGTSMAAPHVAGVASLMYSRNPSLTPAQVLSILQSTATPFPAGSTCSTSNCGSGIVNAAAAVAAVSSPGDKKIYMPVVARAAPPAPGAPVLNAINNADGDGNYDVTWNAVSGATSYTLQESFNNAFFTSPTNVYSGSGTSWSASGKAAGTYYYRVNASNAGGSSGWSATQSTVVNPSAGWTTLVSTDFEGAWPSPWSVYDNNGATYGEYYWGKRTCRANAGSYSGWGVGAGAQGSGLSCGANYPDNAGSMMVYGPFSLSSTTAAELRYKLWLTTASSADSVCRMASIDGINYYGSCTSGSSGAWIDRVLDLANVYLIGSLLGQPNVWVAIQFRSDSSVNYAEGGYVDDIVLRKCPTGSTCPAGAAPALAGDHLLEYPATMTLTKQQ